MWQRDTSVECSDEDEGSNTITDGSTNYVIMGLAGISSYTISVRASNEAGTALSNTLTVMTTAAGTSIQECVSTGILHNFFGSTAPSAPPTPINASNVIPNSFTVQWGAVDCIHHNGDITGYSVRYGVQGSGSTQTRDFSEGDMMTTAIMDLMPDTSYVVEVAGMNANGVGEYGSIVVTTPQS